MKLKLLNFVENKGKPNVWGYDGLTLRQRNLIVGVNASGKSRTLKSIEILASLLSKRTTLANSVGPTEWQASFVDDENVEYLYELEIVGSAVTREKFSKAGDVLLDRPAGAGPATIRMERAGSLPENIQFQIPATELAAANKMDLIQTPFLVPLVKWGESVFYYRFGTALGQNTMGMKSASNAVNIEQIEHDMDAALPVFTISRERFPEYADYLKEDMRRMGYAIESADVIPPSIFINAPPGLVGLAVKEEDLDFPTEQLGMSQGMFRAYSILIHANHLVLAKKCGCLLIDDIGEGLDFGRSRTLIDILMEKAQAGGFQLLMATNDRFIMNHVPLEDWTVIKRSKGRANLYNYSNSKKHFDEFRFMGLNNFDFLAMDFLSENVDNFLEEEAKK